MLDILKVNAKIEDPIIEKPISKRPLQDDESNSQDVKGSPQEDDLIDVSQERKNNETSCRENEVTNVCPKRTDNITCAGSNKEPQETGRLSPKMHQESLRRIPYGGAKVFYLEGAKEYTVDEQFFKLGDRF